MSEPDIHIEGFNQNTLGSRGRREGDRDDYDEQEEREIIEAYMQSAGRKWLAKRKAIWLREGK